jgi:pimeloyl-ACP methyl ester carboxylesterase
MADGEGSLEREGRRVAWRDGGDGPPLLLLQGYGGTADDWDPTFLGALEATFRVVRPDPRGMGDSSFGDPAEELTIESRAADVADQQVGELVAAARARIDPRVLRAEEAALVRWHAEPPPPVPADPPPVLAIAGAEDIVIPAANVERLAVMWPGCRTEVVPDAGHAVMAQEPERVAALIRSLA